MEEVNWLKLVFFMNVFYEFWILFILIFGFVE